MALCIIAASFIVAFYIAESHIEEAIIDEWDPITPSTLYPQNVTGWSFIALTPQGSFLELNITASGNVTVIVGKLVFYNETTREEQWSNVIFNQTGMSFLSKIEIVNKDVDFLEIKNDGTKPVDVSGNIKKLDYVKRPYYPYLSLGALTFLIGLTILVYGITTESKRKKRRSPNKTKTQIFKLFIFVCEYYAKS